MIWTTKKPDEEGFYWITEFEGGNHKIDCRFIGRHIIDLIFKNDDTFYLKSDAELWADASLGKIDLFFYCKVPSPMVPVVPCKHTTEKLTKTYSSNTGNYDPSADIYSINVKCECGKIWFASTLKSEEDEYHRLSTLECGKEITKPEYY